MSNSVIVNPSQSVKVIIDDPADNKILECALEGKSEFIISGDRHLLSLGEYLLRYKDFTGSGLFKGA